MHILICDPDKAIMEGPKNMHVHVYTCIHARIYICAGRLPGSAGRLPGSAGRLPGSAGRLPGSAGRLLGSAGRLLGSAGGCWGVHIISQAGHGAQRVTIIGRTRLPST